MLNEAYDCYEYYSEGLLPSKGIILDQSNFFITVSKLVKNQVKISERERLEKNKER